MYLAKSIAASGLRNQQYRIDTLANNVSNANTHGYKNSRLDFKDSLYTNGITPGPARNPQENQQKGHGLMVTAITRDFKPGILERTERNLDFAIEGEGFFAFQNQNGDIVYGRSGAFNLSVEGAGTFLVNGQGMYVLDENENRIQVPFGATSITSAANGAIVFTDGNGNELGDATIGMFTFRNLKGLESVGDSMFSQTPASGERRLSESAALRQGVLEGSNVNLSEEMTRLIRTQRAFQLASRALTTADEMEGIANNMRR